MIAWWYCRAVYVSTAGARDILGTRHPLMFIPTFPTGSERTASTRLPYIVNVDFSCSSQPFCLPWAKNRGHTLPEKKKKKPHEISATFGSGTHTPANCKILYSVFIRFDSVLAAMWKKASDARFQTHKLTIMFTILEHFTMRRNITGF